MASFILKALVGSVAHCRHAAVGRSTNCASRCAVELTSKRIFNPSGGTMQFRHSPGST